MNSAEPRLSVLVVAYNSRDFIDDCLHSAMSGASKNEIEVLLVDNGQDGTAELVAAHHPGVRIVAGRGNIGFAAANNLLASEARGRFLLLLNPDMSLEEGAIDALLAGAERHDGAGAWGGVTVDADGTVDTGNAIAIPSLKEFASGALGRSLAGRERARSVEEDREVPVLSGAFLMIRRNLWEEIGGLDERFFLYCEEVDLCHRLRQRGLALWQVARARGEHRAAHGATLSPKRLLLRTAGTVEFLRKHWSPWRRWIGTFLIWLAALERFLVGSTLGRGNRRLRELAHGYRDVALKPRLWMHGYDPVRGLMARQGVQ